eukprot:342081_1
MVLSSPENLTIGTQLKSAQILYHKVVSGVELNKTETANKCVALLEHLQNAVAREGLISKNEGCNDMSTADLGLLVIEYLFGNLLLKLPFSHSNPAGRRATIDRADALFNEYLGRCHSVGVLSPSVYAEFEDEVEGRCNYSPAEVRRRKIDHHKWLNSSQLHLDELATELNEDEDGSQTLTKDTEKRREHTILMLQIYAREAVEALHIIRIERELIENRPEPQNLEREKDLKGTDGMPNTSGFNPSKSEGLRVTHVSKQNGQLQMQRDVIKGKIFQRTVAPPTMSVEEWGKIEMERALERQNEVVN